MGAWCIRLEGGIRVLEQYRYKRGALPSPPDDRDYSLHVPMAAALPERYIPEIKPVIGKQAHSNCTAWALAYAYEASQQKQFSKGYLYGEREETDYQGQGMYLRDILKGALKHGNVLYPTYPYEYEVTKAQRHVRDRQAALRQAAAPYRIEAYAKLNNAYEAKQARLSGMGVIFSAACSHLKAGMNNVLPMNFPTYGHHAMAVIGWDDNYNGGAYAYCSQSWGTAFGDTGFCYVLWTDIFRDWDVWAVTFAEETDPTKPYIRRTLRKGMEGEDVKELQTLLVDIGFAVGTIDGIFGSKTDSAVREYQRSRNLMVDGIVGTDTWAALDAGAEPAEPSPLLDEFIAYLEEQVKNHSGYCWGAQGQLNTTATDAWIRQRETSTANANRAIAFKNKQIAAGYGNVMRWFDCSGLGMYFLQNMKGVYKGDMSANTMMGKCAKITRSELRRGDWVFRVSDKAYHIGYIVDDNLNVIEAMGRDEGVVKRPLNASGTSYWNAYGRPAAFESEPQPEPKPEPTPEPTESIFAICTGESVNLRAGRGTQYDILGVVRKDDKLLAMPEVDGWHEVAAVIGGKIVVGYMSGKYVKGD